MTRLRAFVWRNATPKRLLVSFLGAAALAAAENLLDLPPGVPYMRRVTGGLDFLDFGFEPADHAHALLEAFGPAGRSTQWLLTCTVDVLIPAAFAVFGVLAIVTLGRALLRTPGRWLAAALLPVLAALLDYAENGTIAALLLTFPHDPVGLSVLTHRLTQAKTLAYASVLLLLLVGGAALAVRAWRRSRGSWWCNMSWLSCGGDSPARVDSRGSTPPPIASAEEVVRMRVLIVDDSRLARMMLRKALPPSLLTEVVEATNGREAVQCVRASHIDLMLLDLTMPDGDGYKVLKTLQEAGQTPPTIVVSADVQALAEQRVMELGAIAFLKKSIKPEELTVVLKRAGLI